MITRVVHLPDAIHARAKKYCYENGVTMTSWVSQLVHAAVKTQLSSLETTDNGKSNDISSQP